jgi:hypothetical protein
LVQKRISVTAFDQRIETQHRAKSDLRSSPIGFEYIAINIDGASKRFRLPFPAIETSRLEPIDVYRRNIVPCSISIEPSSNIFMYAYSGDESGSHDVPILRGTSDRRRLSTIASLHVRNVRRGSRTVLMFDRRRCGFFSSAVLCYVSACSSGFLAMGCSGIGAA